MSQVPDQPLPPQGKFGLAELEKSASVRVCFRSFIEHLARCGINIVGLPLLLTDDEYALVEMPNLHNVEEGREVGLRIERRQSYRVVLAKLRFLIYVHLYNLSIESGAMFPKYELTDRFAFYFPLFFFPFCSLLLLLIL
jgi:hypothetical protein